MQTGTAYHPKTNRGRFPGRAFLSTQSGPCVRGLFSCKTRLIGLMSFSHQELVVCSNVELESETHLDPTLAL